MTCVLSRRQLTLSVEQVICMVSATWWFGVLPYLSCKGPDAACCKSKCGTLGQTVLRLVMDCFQWPCGSLVSSFRHVLEVRRVLGAVWCAYAGYIKSLMPLEHLRVLWKAVGATTGGYSILQHTGSAALGQPEICLWYLGEAWKNVDM